MIPTPIICTNVRRNLKRGPVVGGVTLRIADIFMFDDYGAQEHFERTAVTAARRLVKATTR